MGTLSKRMNDRGEEDAQASLHHISDVDIVLLVYHLLLS